MLLAGLIMFIVAQVPPQRLMSFAVPLYTVGVGLLIAVAIFGITKKGAKRWINVGIVIQPSEILKIAMPLMLAWWFQKREGQLRPLDFVVATGVAHTVEDFVREAFARAGVEDWRAHIETDPALVRPADAALQLGDATRARTVLGWAPTVQFEEMVARMVDHDVALLAAEG